MSEELSSLWMDGWTDAGNDNTPSAWKAEGKNADQYAIIFIQEHYFENVICIKGAILLSPQCANFSQTPDPKIAVLTQATTWRRYIAE